MGDGLSIIWSLLDNGFPDKGSHTCIIIILTVLLNRKHARHCGNLQRRGAECCCVVSVVHVVRTGSGGISRERQLQVYSFK
ncbi:hypothetical protein XENTR_v10010847 [Xenopus tropicalis]|nr:hypothetical protein XENTR_v10010847 [Xenopus tropicalis]